MVTSIYKFSAKYVVNDFDRKVAKDLDSQIQHLRKLYRDELLHCIFPLKLQFSIGAEYEDDDKLYIKLSCKDLTTEDVIDTTKLKEHLIKKFKSVCDGLFDIQSLSITHVK